MNERIYIAEYAGTTAMVKAGNQAAVRNLIAKDIINVRVASAHDVYELTRAGNTIKQAVKETKDGIAE